MGQPAHLQDPVPVLEPSEPCHLGHSGLGCLSGDSSVTTQNFQYISNVKYGTRSERETTKFYLGPMYTEASIWQPYLSKS